MTVFAFWMLPSPVWAETPLPYNCTGTPNSVCEQNGGQCINGYCYSVPATPTPIPTSTSACTGTDGSNPCQQYSCPNNCSANGGECINGYCFPKTCRSGRSKNDCPSGYTCQKGGCTAGYIVCIGGMGNVSCDNTTDCPRECGDPKATCKSGGNCYVDPNSPNPPTPTSSPSNAFDPTCGINKSGIDTALGCLPTDPQTFVGLVIPWAVGIGGGIAFLLMLYGVFMIIVSAGVPDKMQAGKELISSAITGLLIIIFAVFILRFIGVDVLGLFS